MRPVKLRFSGLRSYRSDAEIDFADLDLFAIIGDTGAGKSTIIEALCLALYGKKSWSGGISTTDLIADGQDVMRIELEFVADDHPWKVTRARQRNGSSPVDKLESLDRSAPNVDQSRPVTDKIEELIGLNLQQFTRAVVMPQGRFDELLQATETERNKILASILGHGDLEAVQREARNIRDVVAPRADVLQGARSQLPADPTAARDAARMAVDDAEARRAFLAERSGRLAEPAGRASALAAALPTLAAALAAVPAFSVDPAAEVTGLATRCGELEVQLTDARRRAETERTRVSSCDSEITEALAGFSDRDVVLTTKLRLDEAARDLPGDLSHLADAERVVAELEADPPSPTVDPELAVELSEATAKRTTAEAALQTAHHDVAAARASWENLVQARSDEATAAAAATELDADEAAKAETAATSQREVERCAGLVERARTAVSHAEQANRVAAIAGDHRPGDDCPVCSQELPEGFHVAGAADLDAIKLELADLVGAHRNADAAARAAVADHVAAVERASNASRRQADASQAVTATLERAESLGVDTSAETEDEALHRLLTEVSASQALVDAAAEAERVARSALDGAEGERKHRVESYQQELARARSAVAAAEERVARHTQRCEGLPLRWAPSDSDRLDAEMLAAIAGRLDDTLVEIDRLSGERDEAQAAVVAAESDASRIAAEMTEHVVRPAERSVRSTVDHVAAVAAACRTANSAAAALEVDAIDVPGTAGLPADVTPSAIPTLPPAVAAVLERATSALDSARDLAQRARVAHDDAAAAVTAALDATDCASAGELHTALSLAENHLERRRDEFDAIDAQATEAEAIDAKLAVVVPLRENLDVLVASLANRQFVDHLLNLREAELLAEASRRLRDISGDRFAFAPEFGVVSTASGQVRSPDALSGGERFQASLALALALVEIASRGGGRLDAVFVDEGFGSLDANALDDALDALGKVAGGGKMVALISHLRSVAEYVDTVIHVSRDDVLGSSLTLLTEGERDALLSDDMQAGLTT
ncbi:AAA family ATPase [Ilumatobacter coccineus]|uniref:Nuclease SbcCD subunit C n=1 Tax=Ilumatobacter coccineus (strain NBRC 103263 / KCTC 29153 / YM16-304) TaxID=1313172 RepID=A0A6C7EHD2_ILUCY|nr:SMC family ATPase [Ilumatobacter coccineus]BAN04385.1 putative nuclease SbcCD subunit C [Ilumatobacter coccineus YM16-304]